MIALCRIFLSHLNQKLDYRFICFNTSMFLATFAVIPFFRYQIPVPAKDCIRRDDTANLG